MGLPRYPRLGFQGHTSSPSPLRIEHRIGGSGPTRRQQSGSRRCASVGSAAISNRPRTNRTEVGKAEMAHRWRGSTFFFFAERMTHRPTCQPLWRERSGSHQPGSRRIPDRVSRSVPEREETVPTRFLRSGMRPAPFTKRGNWWQWPPKCRATNLAGRFTLPFFAPCANLNPVRRLFPFKHLPEPLSAETPVSREFPPCVPSFVCR